MTVTCGVWVGEYPDIDCVVASHYKPCVVFNREKYNSFGVCSACGVGGISGGGTYQYDTHVERCRHSSTDEVIYETCNYR